MSRGRFSGDFVWANQDCSLAGFQLCEVPITIVDNFDASGTVNVEGRALAKGRNQKKGKGTSKGGS
ncbi:putative Bug-like extra-cytoplasmic solute receptor, TTT family [Sesbania bispinosa]|nr:putative Bug-like extra-cytoplasmic solute receptor, TTT family [Sesbania bispinosa]